MAHPKLALARSLGASVSVAALLSLPPAPAVAQICGLTLDQTAAHLSHTRANPARAALACAECHPQVCDPAAERVTFGALAAAGGATPSWDAGSRTCSGVYCHGATLGGGTYTAPGWADDLADGIQCGDCHAIPPPSPHPQEDAESCAECHEGAISGGQPNPSTHIDGAVQFEDDDKALGARP